MLRQHRAAARTQPAAPLRGRRADAEVVGTRVIPRRAPAVDTGSPQARLLPCPALPPPLARRCGRGGAAARQSAFPASAAVPENRRLRAKPPPKRASRKPWRDVATLCARGAHPRERSQHAPDGRCCFVTRTAPSLTPHAPRQASQAASALCVTRADAVLLALASLSRAVAPPRVDEDNVVSFCIDDLRPHLPAEHRKMPYDTLREALHELKRPRPRCPQLLVGRPTERQKCRWGFVPEAAAALHAGPASLLAVRVLQEGAAAAAVARGDAVTGAAAQPPERAAAALEQLAPGAPPGPPRQLPPGCLVIPGAVTWAPEFEKVTRLLVTGGKVIDGGQAMDTVEEQRDRLKKSALSSRQKRLMLAALDARQEAIKNACLAALPAVADGLLHAPDAPRRLLGKRMRDEYLQRRPGEAEADVRARLLSRLAEGTRLSSDGRNGAEQQAVHADGPSVSFVFGMTEGPATLVDVGPDWSVEELESFVRLHEGEGWRVADVADAQAAQALTWCGPCLLPAELAAARLRPMATQLAPGTLQVLPFWQRHAGPAAKNRDVAFLTWTMDGETYSDDSHLLPWSLSLRSRAFHLAAARLADYTDREANLADARLGGLLKDAVATHREVRRASDALDALYAARVPSDSPAAPALVEARAAAYKADVAHEAAIAALSSAYGATDDGDAAQAEAQVDAAAPRAAKRARRA